MRPLSHGSLTVAVGYEDTAPAGLADIIENSAIPRPAPWAMIFRPLRGLTGERPPLHAAGGHFGPRRSDRAILAVRHSHYRAFQPWNQPFGAILP